MDGGRVVSVVSAAAAAAAAKPAEREGERRGVLHTSSCRLKREDEGGKGGRAGVAGRTPDNASGQKHGGDERRTRTALVVVSVVF